VLFGFSFQFNLNDLFVFNLLTKGNDSAFLAECGLAVSILVDAGKLYSRNVKVLVPDMTTVFIKSKTFLCKYPNSVSVLLIKGNKFPIKLILLFWFLVREKVANMGNKFQKIWDCFSFHVEIEIEREIEKK